MLTVFHPVGTHSSFSVLMTENETKHHKTKQMQPHRACTTPVRGHINGWHLNQNGTEQCQSQSKGTDSDREEDRNKSWKRHERVMASCFEDRDRDEHGDRYGYRTLNLGINIDIDIARRKQENSQQVLGQVKLCKNTVPQEQSAFSDTDRLLKSLI